MASASMFYRRDLEKDIPEWRKNAPIGDYALVLQLSTLGKVGYIKDNMCCYRVNTEGSWTKRIAIDNEMYKKWYKGCMKMFDGYDAWSCNKYHKYIMSMKNKLRIARVKRFIHKFI